MPHFSDSIYASDKDCLSCLIVLLQTYRPTSLADCLRLTALAERIYATFPLEESERH
ncbi:MAG: hypothetical protein ACFCUJ_09730 [Thiotrichales bacterium]